MQRQASDSRMGNDVGRAIFGADADGYDSARPDYPESVYTWLESEGVLAPGGHLFEVGPGTGQATRRLLHSAPARLVAIEPDAKLAAHLERLKDGPSSPLQIVNTRFEIAPLANATFDLGIAATAFHWLDPDQALPRIKALLRSGGAWAMWWNIVHDPAADPFSKAVLPILADVALPPSISGSEHDHYALDAPARIASLEAAGFLRVRQTMLSFERHMTAKELRALYATFSMVRQLPVDRRMKALDAIERLANEAFDGGFVRRFRTPAYLGWNP